MGMTFQITVMTRFILSAAVSLVVVAAPPVYAQQYPIKPIRIIVSSAAGGGSDFIARVVGQRITESLGQQVIVENRPGGGGTIGHEAGIRSAPDGYTLNV